MCSFFPKYKVSHVCGLKDYITVVFMLGKWHPYFLSKITSGEIFYFLVT